MKRIVLVVLVALSSVGCVVASKGRIGAIEMMPLPSSAPRPALPKEARVVVAETASIQDLLVAIGDFASQHGAQGTCHIAVRSEVAGATQLIFGAGGEIVAGAFSCDFLDLLPAIAGRAVYLRESWLDANGQLAAHLLYFGPRGAGYLGRDRADTAVATPANATMRMLKQADDVCVVISLPRPPAGTAGPPTTSPTSGSPGEASSEEDLSWNDILPVVRKKPEDFAACLKGEDSAESFRGAVVFDFTITPEGKASEVSLFSSTLPDPANDTCIERIVRSWNFPKPKRGRPVLVSMPLLFNMAESTASTTAGKGLAPGEIQKAIQQHMEEVDQCYLGELKAQNRELEGKLIVRFTLQPNGSAASIDLAKESSLVDPALFGCIAKRMQTWRFPSPGPQPTTISYPYLFQLDDPGAKNPAKPQ